MIYCEVAVNYPRKQVLTYKFIGENLKPGQLVHVGLGKRKVLGCLIREKSLESLDFDPKKIKPIDEVIDPLTIIPEDYLELFSWVANYYHYPIGKLIFDSLPKILKRPRKLQKHHKKEKASTVHLSDAQKNIFAKLELAHGYQSYLLHGVTGSGKSLLYIQAAVEVLKQKKSVLFLIPEINLTPQFISFFKEYIDVPLFTYNSQESGSQRYGLLQKLLAADEPVLIIGVRSAVFLPIINLGLIVVDEFHDGSFKQEDRCCYHAKDVALKLAQIKKIPLILGSATPSLESYEYFRYRNPERYLPLEERFAGAHLPKISLTSLKDTEDKYDEEIWPFYPETFKKLEANLRAGGKSIIFVNRLGYANYIECRNCRHIFECSNCSVPLKYYKKTNILKCHYCAFKQYKENFCPYCNSMTFNHKGFGTEKIYDLLSRKLPSVHLERFDRDIIKSHDDLLKVLKVVEEGDVDVLIGTQMISKGHNFVGVNQVVVLGIDQILNMPDFRANEKVYQLLTQVSGRAGRFGEDAEVLIQTLHPQNKVFQMIAANSFHSFYEDEREIRQEFSMPPFEKIAMVYASGPTKDALISFMQTLEGHARSLQKMHFKNVKILPARSAMIEKLVNNYTWSLHLQSANINELHNLLKSLESNLKIPPKIKLRLDIDPLNIF